jgi:hypothetical protein
VSRWLAVLAAGLILTACGTTGGASAPPSTTAGSSTSTSTTSTSAVGSPPPTEEPPTLSLTAAGLGPVRIGMTLEDVQATGFAGRFEPGCEVESPPPLTAPLSEVEGTVDVAGGTVRSITVRQTDGVTTSPGSVAPGDPVDAAVSAWEAAGLAVTVDEEQADTYGVWFVQVRDGDEPAFEATADPARRTLLAISVPEVVLCE